MFSKFIVQCNIVSLCKIVVIANPNILTLSLFVFSGQY